MMQEVYLFMHTIIQKGSVWTESGFIQKDLLIIDGIIQRIAESIPLQGNAEIIDAGGKWIVPGFIDPHVHFNEPGRTEWEGIRSGSAAAAAGGITTIVDMPLNSHPSVTTGQLALAKKSSLDGRSYVDYGLWGGITADNCRNHSELNNQLSHGLIGFKGFMSNSGILDFPYLDRSALREAMAFCAERQVLLALHAEAEEELAKTAHRQGSSRRSFLDSRPIEAELRAIEWIIEDALRYGTAVHVVHVSSADGVLMLNEAKRSGADITIETCPHYLLFTDEDFIHEGPELKCAPPLRSDEVREELWDVLSKGMIDTIGSDHSPCPLSMKEAGNEDIREAWGGIQGVQFGHRALLSEGLKRGLSFKTLLPMMTRNPANRFFPEGAGGIIAPGTPADLTLIKEKEATIHNTEILFKNKRSPYAGMKVQLEFDRVLLRGKSIYQGGAWVTGPPTGKCLTWGGMQDDQGKLRRIY